MSSLRDRIVKNSTIKETSVLSESKVYNEKDMIQTTVPMVNVALSGEFDGGLTPGLLLLCGNSKMFKTGYALLMMKAYLDKYPEGIALVYDSEFGSPPSYYNSYDIDMDRVVHTPIKNIEEFKFDIMQQLENIGRGDKVFIMIDSIGNLASKKEVEDAIKGSSAADMTRAKQLKSCFRMITPYLTLNDIPMVAINHIYMTQEMFSKAVVSGGCLVEDTEILLADGSSKNIQDIVLGEIVETLNGPQEVTNIWDPETLENGNPDCYEIEFEDGTSIICSASHEFLVNGEWIEAQELIIGTDVKSV